jgi:hypothetical protein
VAFCPSSLFFELLVYSYSLFFIFYSLASFFFSDLLGLSYYYSDDSDDEDEDEDSTYYE